MFCLHFYVVKYNHWERQVFIIDIKQHRDQLKKLLNLGKNAVLENIELRLRFYRVHLNFLLSLQSQSRRNV